MEKVFEKVNCAICGANNTHEVSKKGQFDLPINLVLCKDCGLGYLNPRWDVDSYLDFYKNEYDNYYRGELNAAFKLAPKFDNLIIARLKQWNHLPERIDNILDIGSGAGQNLVDFKGQYPSANLFAIEPSPDSHKHLASIDTKVISSDVDSGWNLGNEQKYDLVIMRHVLEHFLDPVAVMKKVRQVLKPDGLIYLAVPNNLKTGKNLESHWFRVVHTYYFNKFSLYNLFALAGLEILKVGEGDQRSPHEIFLVARPAKEMLNTKIDSADFIKQKTVFEDQLRADGKLIPGLKRKVNDWLKKR